jgi:hypothetical protein
MSAVQWRSLSSRLGSGLDGGPVGLVWREPVPAALEQPLRLWVHHTLTGTSFQTPSGPRRGIYRQWYEVATDRLALRMNIVPPFEGTGWPRHFAYATDMVMLLDVVDAILDLMPPGVITRDKEGAEIERHDQLQQLLDDVQSVLRVRADGRGLERRADLMAEAAFEAAVEGAEAASWAGSADRHLRAAWGCVHALRPDPEKAYGEAIKAVEAAAQGIVEPNNHKATLGTMRGTLRANRDRFSLVIPGPDGRGNVEPLIECISLLWEGQSSRHGSSRKTRPETLEEATVAVHLAVMLVQWFTSGAVRELTQ